MEYRYQVGGSLAVDAVSYVERKADCELYQHLLEGDCCYIFNSRQMGKSSLLVQTFHRLRQEGYRCAIIDLTSIGSEQVTTLQWYKGLVAQIYTELGLKDILRFKNWWQEQEDFSYLQRLSRFVEELLTVHFPDEKIFIFIDEIDTVLSLNFTVDDLFALIRYCHERRTINPNYQRITFALSGVAAPSDLIRDRQRTPFNIGRAIALKNFQLPEVKPLLIGLRSSFNDPDKLMQEIINWTGGQPFLTQKLCNLIISNNRDGLIVYVNTEAAYVANLVKTKIINNWESQDEPEHFRTIRDRLFYREKLTGRLLGIYQQILASQQVKADDSREHIELFLSGLIVKQAGYLQVKNLIYAAIFNLEWVETQLQNLRPYSQTFQAWTASKQTDESRLLKGKALQDALLWSQGKSLSDLDYQYLAASQEADRQEVQKTFEAARLQEVQTRLVEVEKRRKQEQKANRLQRWLLAVASAGFIITSGLGITAYIQYRNAALGEINALVASAGGLFNSDRPLDALVAAIKAYEKTGQINLNDDETNDEVEQTLKKTVYGGIESNRFSGFEGGVHAITFSPDGQTIATGTLGNKVKLWQKNGILRKTLTEHEDSIWALAYSPDGSLLASGSADGAIKLWQKDDILGQTLQGHQWGVWHVVFSPDGKLIASSGLDGKINLWQADGTLLKTIIEDSAMLGLAFSPDGEILATGGNDTVIKLRNLDGEVFQTLENNGAIQRLAFSPDGQILAAAINNGTVKLWHRDGRLLTTIDAHSDVIDDLDFSPEGQTLVSGSRDGTVKLWQLNGKLLLTLSGYEGGVRGVEFSPDGKIIASASIDNTVRLWQPQGNKSVQIIRQASAVSGLAVSADGQLIASGNDDGTAKLWDNRGNLLQNMSNRDREITSIAFSPHGKTIASGGRDRTVNLWDIDGNLLNSVTDHDDMVDTVDYFPLSNSKLQSNSAVFVTAGWDGNLKFRDRLGNTLKTIKVCNQISTFNFSPDGKLMFVGCIEDSTIKILDDSGQLIRTLKGHQANVLSIVFDRDRARIISSSINVTIKLWNLDGTLHKNLSGHSSAVWSVDLSPDNRLIATASSDRTIKLWKADGTLLKTLNGHTQTVNNVVFSPDGKSLISSSDDKTIRIWNLDIVLDTESIYQQGCNLIRDYLRHNAEVEESDRALCDDVEE